MYENTSRVEQALLCNFDEIGDTSNLPKCVNDILSGDLLSVIKGPLLENILNDNFSKNIILRFLNQYETYEQQLEILSVGISSLLLFIQDNFTGPKLQVNIADISGVQLQDVFDTSSMLTIDGEEINVNVTNSELFLIAYNIIEAYRDTFHTFLSQVWYLRVLVVYQKILDENSPKICSKIEQTILNIKQENEPSDTRIKARFYVEAAHSLLIYGKVTKCEEFINLANELLGIKLELIGELGKRTKYQTKNVAQMCLHFNLSDIPRPKVIPESFLPEILKLEDDLLLDSIQWMDSSLNNDIKILPCLEQSVVLLYVLHKQRALPQDDLTKEESLPVLNYILKQNCCWSARTNALSLRCHLESKHKRTVERSLSQLESVLNHINSSETPIVNRLYAFWAVGLSPLWKFQSQLADLTLSLGLVKVALEMYLSLQLWEDVIVCYTILQLRHKAAEIIQQEIDKKPTVKLLCLLGDATDDVNCYEKAWELSGKKSGRPYRHWGQYLFNKKEYKECIPYLKKSLEINSLQGTAWLQLGYAALHIEDWTTAATAYRRYTVIEPGCFEAWNNLARVYIALGDKSRAYKALNEALKTSFDNWKVWENLLITSIDIGRFDDVIRCYHRLLDLKEKHLDTQVLNILVNAILDDINDFEGNSTKRLMQKCLELLGRISSLYPNNYDIWNLYAELSSNSSLKAQRLQRAYRALVQDSDWGKDTEKCGKVLDVCFRLNNACLEANDASLTSSIKLSLRSALKVVKNQDWPEHKDSIEKLGQLFEEIENKND